MWFRVGVIALVAVVVILWLVRVVNRPRGMFEIRVGRDGLRIHGSVPGFSNAEVRDFFGRLRLPSGSRVWGTPDNGRFRVEFNEYVPADERQRVRNFLYVHSG